MLTLYSPAKLNLFLRILHRRQDGYHQLASLFQAISLMDRLHFKICSKNPCDKLTSEGILMPTDPSNLILRAFRLFREKTGLPIHVEVHVEKRIPLEAGLGGGSSNAATAMWAINRLAGSPAKLSDLISWCGELGSDVPFFLSSGTAYCTGRGEVIKDLPPLPDQPLITIIKPSCGLSTGRVYNNLKINNLYNRDPDVTLSAFYQGNPDYYNDLESTALELEPMLKQLKSHLQKSSQTALLAGSGTSFFCVNSDVIDLPAEYFLENAHFVRRTEEEWYQPEVSIKKYS